MYAHLFVGVFLVYLPFVHGDVSWLDGGHLTAAAVELGVPHATGFPLFVICAHALTLVPFGSLAFKVALLSSLAVAGATTLVLGIARNNGARAWPALCGALLFPFTFQVWLNGQLAEVYALNAFLIALLAYLLWRPKPRIETALFVTGLGLGSHATFVGAAACMWVVLIVNERCFRRMLKGVPILFVGALIIAYLPLAAGRETLTNWGGGSVATMSGLWDHLTASGIRDSFAEEMGSQDHLGHQISTWMDLAGGELFPVLLGLFLLSYFWMPQRRIFVAMLAVLIVDMLFSCFINPMGQQDLQTGMPGALMLGIGVSLTAGLSRFPSPKFRRVAEVARVTVLIALSVMQIGERWHDRDTDSVAGMHGRFVMLELLPDSTLFATGDNVPGQSLYLQSVEGLRPDALVLVSQQISDETSVQYAYSRAGRDMPDSYLSAPQDASFERVRALYSAAIKERPVYWRLSIGAFDKVVRPHLRPGLFVHRMELESQPRRCHQTLADSSSGVLSRMTRFQEPTFRTRNEFSEYSRMNALWCIFAGREQRGLAMAQHAVTLAPSSVRALTMFATLVRRSSPERAREYLMRANAIDPTYERSGRLLKKYFGD